MTSGALVYLAIFVLVSIIVALLVFYRRPTIASGQPTGTEAKIIQLADAERAKIAGSMPSGSEVRRMSDAELERAINKRPPAGD